MNFVLVFKCVDVKSGRVRVAYHLPVTFPRIMASRKLLTSLCPKFIICKMDKIMPTSNMKLFHAG